MKIYGRVIMTSADPHTNPATRASIERIGHSEIEYQTGLTPERGTWELIPAHEATWEDPDTGEEQTAWFEDQWRYLVEVEVPDDWEEKRYE